MCMDSSSEIKSLQELWKELGERIQWHSSRSQDHAHLWMWSHAMISDDQLQMPVIAYYQINNRSNISQRDSIVGFFFDFGSHPMPSSELTWVTGSWHVSILYPFRTSKSHLFPPIWFSDAVFFIRLRPCMIAMYLFSSKPRYEERLHVLALT